MEAKHTVYNPDYSDTWTDVPTSAVAATLADANRVVPGYRVRVERVVVELVQTRTTDLGGMLIEEQWTQPCWCPPSEVDTMRVLDAGHPDAEQAQ